MCFIKEKKIVTGCAAVPRGDLDFFFCAFYITIKMSLNSLLFFPQKQQKTTARAEYELHRFPKPQRTRCKRRMIKKENIWWAEHSARTRQSHVSGNCIPTQTHTHTSTQTLVRTRPNIHSCMLTRSSLHPKLANK